MFKQQKRGRKKRRHGAFAGNDFGHFKCERAASPDLQEIISEDCERCTVKCGGVK